MLNLFVRKGTCLCTWKDPGFILLMPGSIINYWRVNVMFPIDEVVKCCQPSEVVITMSVPDTDVGVNVAVFPFTV